MEERFVISRQQAPRDILAWDAADRCNTHMWWWNIWFLGIFVAVLMHSDYNSAFLKLFEDFRVLKLAYIAYLFCQRACSCQHKDHAWSPVFGMQCRWRLCSLYSIPRCDLLTIWSTGNRMFLCISATIYICTIWLLNFPSLYTGMSDQVHAIHLLTGMSLQVQKSCAHVRFHK